MTKHNAGKHGRTIGRREPKAGWPAPASAWCYRCSGTHLWEEGCPAGHGDLATRMTIPAPSASIPVSPLDRW